jgi:hypothetical protein
MPGYLKTGLYGNFMDFLLLWLGAVHCINMWLICRMTEQSSPIKTVQYFVYSHIQEDTVKMSNSWQSDQEENSTSAIPRCFQYARHLDVIVLYGTHWKILLFDTTFWIRKKITSGKYNVVSWTRLADGFFTRFNIEKKVKLRTFIFLCTGRGLQLLNFEWWYT